MTNSDKLLVLWSLSMYHESIKRYYAAVRNYCLGKGTWEEAQAARKDAHFYGVNDEKLASVELDAMKSITDEEFYESIYGE